MDKKSEKIGVGKVKTKKVWAVKDGDREIYFSTKKKANQFVDIIYHNPDAEIVCCGNLETDAADIYIYGPFIYHTTFIVPDKQETIFIGYSMDLTDERDIVFEIKRGVFTVVTRAYSYEQAININGTTLVGAIKYGAFNGEYNRPGYIRYYEDEGPWEESPSTYCN